MIHRTFEALGGKNGQLQSDQVRRSPGEGMSGLVMLALLRTATAQDCEEWVLSTQVELATDAFTSAELELTEELTRNAIEQLECLDRVASQEDLATLGLSIFTSFDPILQRQAERSTTAVLDQLDPKGGLESATVVTRFDSGEVVALVGGRNVRYAGFNRALDARRPAGSLLKPAIYLAALEQPGRFSLATTLSDRPLQWKC